MEYEAIWKGLHKKSVVRGIVRLTQERAKQTMGDIPPRWGGAG